MISRANDEPEVQHSYTEMLAICEAGKVSPPVEMIPKRPSPA